MRALQIPRGRQILSILWFEMLKHIKALTVDKYSLLIVNLILNKYKVFFVDTYYIILLIAVLF